MQTFYYKSGSTNFCFETQYWLIPEIFIYVSVTREVQLEQQIIQKKNGRQPIDCPPSKL